LQAFALCLQFVLLSFSIASYLLDRYTPAAH